MPDSVQTLIDEIVATVDVTPAQALTALNRRHRAMVARGRSFRKALVVAGGTVAGQRDYVLDATVVEVLELRVNGTPYGKGRHADLAYGALGRLVMTDEDGIWTTDASSAGVTEVSLYPTPTTSGLEIALFAAVLPDELLAADPGTAIRVDADFYDALVEGAVATFLARQGEGEPDRLEARFEAKCEEWRRRARRRERGGGPAQIRVVQRFA